MADLDPTLPLMGIATTHPTLAETPGDAALQAAQTQDVQSQIPLRQAQVQGLDIQNQIQQRQLNNAQAYGRAYAQLRGGLLGNQTPTPANAPGTSTSAATSNMPAASSPTTGANVSTTTANTTAIPSGPLGQTPGNADDGTLGTHSVLPNDVDPSWNVDKGINWYVDSDGSPVSFAQGPAFRPDGTLNFHSDKVQQKLADLAEQNGADPGFVAQQWIQSQKDGQDLDDHFATNWKTLQDGRKAAAEAQDAQVKIQQAQQQRVGDIAYQVSQSKSDQPAAFVNAYQQNPIFRAAVQAQIPQNQPLQGPTDPRISGILSTLAVASPNRQKDEELQNAGVHTGPPTIDPDTGAMIPGRPFKVGPNNTVIYLGGGGSTPSSGAGQSGSAASTSEPPSAGNIPARPVVGPAEADTSSGLPLYARREIDALGTFQMVPTDLKTRGGSAAGAIPPATVLAQVSKYYPGYDAGQAPTAVATEKAFASGQQGTTLGTAEAAYNHGNIVLQLAAQAKPDGTLPDIPAVNRLRNILSQGSGGAPITNLNDALNLYATEQAKFIEGGPPSVSSIEEQREKLNAAMSDGQLAGTIATNQALAVEKAKSLKDQYLGGMPNNPQSQALASANFDRKIPTLAPVIASQGNAAQTAATIGNAKLPAGGPKIGDVRGNYAYIGGDPASPASWHKFQ